jgi:hypothetical protein
MVKFSEENFPMVWVSKLPMEQTCLPSQWSDTDGLGGYTGLTAIKAVTKHLLRPIPFYLS